MRRNSIGGDVRKTQTVHTCDRCHGQVVGSPGTRKVPDGWQQVQVPIPGAPMAEGAFTREIIIVAADLCGPCATSLALWMNVDEV